MAVPYDTFFLKAIEAYRSRDDTYLLALRFLHRKCNEMVERTMMQQYDDYKQSILFLYPTDAQSRIESFNDWKARVFKTTMPISFITGLPIPPQAVRWVPVETSSTPLHSHIKKWIKSAHKFFQSENALVVHRSKKASCELCHTDCENCLEALAFFQDQ